MTMTEIDVLAEFDLDKAPPCEYSEHAKCQKVDAPAAYLLHSACPGCPDTAVILICDPCYKDGLSCALECELCGYIGWASEMWRVIQIL